MLLVIIIVVVFVAFYFYGIRNHDYWKKKGVSYEEPMFLFGSNLQHIIDGVSVSERFSNLYRSYPHEKYVGFYEGSDPALLLRDPDMIKRVLQSDFKSFHYRGFHPDRENVEPLMRNLFFADGDIWKLLRQKMTPMFSSGKLKAMFALITERAERLTVIAEELARTRDEVDVRDLVGRYTTDVIGAVGFGIESEALNAETSEVRKLGKRIFAVTKRDFLVSLVKRMFPALSTGLNFVPPEIETTTTSLAKQCMAQRQYKPSGRNDFIDLLLELKQKEVIVGDSLSKTNADGSPAQVELQVDDSLIAAQVFVLFAAGYETSSHVSSFLMHTLAYHPEKQARCQREIDEVLKANDGKLSYDGLKEMKYLEMCLKEAMRLLPSPGFLARRNVSKYTFPQTNVTIDENVLIIISIDALHNDEQYFERPTEFWPERFADSDSKFEKDLYMPFGAGPRACIGERLGLLQSMAAVAAILSKFTLSPSKSTVEKPTIDKNSIIAQNILGGLPLSLKQRNKID